MDETNEMVYGIVELNDHRLGVQIESGKFKGFVYVYDNMRVLNKSQNKIEDDVTDIPEEDLWLDYQFDIISVPEEYQSSEGDQEEFESHTRNILLDILVKHPEAYKLEAR